MKRIPLRDARGKQTEVYVGRPVYAAKGKRARNGHILSNPFRPDAKDNVGASFACVDKYRHWLWKRIKERNKPIMKALAALTPDSVLLCYCASNKPCHADIIIKAWTYCWEQGLLPAYSSPWEYPFPRKLGTAPILFAVTDKQTYTTKSLPSSKVA